jgi:DNA-directed RNA polymerase subunit beta
MKIFLIPNLIDIQTMSYEKFLQKDVDPDKRGNFGLQGAFKSVFPISDYSKKCSLEFVSYKIGDVRYDEKECVQKGMTFAAPYDRGSSSRLRRRSLNESANRSAISKSNEIYFGEIPLMWKRDVHHHGTDG